MNKKSILLLIALVISLISNAQIKQASKIMLSERRDSLNSNELNTLFFSLEDYNQGLKHTPQELIQGKVAGVMISSDNGEPAGEVFIQIRGLSSLSATREPLM